MEKKKTVTTITLNHPVELDSGDKLAELKLRHPTASDLRALLKMDVADPIQSGIEAAALLSGVQAEHIGRVDARDWLRVSQAIERLLAPITELLATNAPAALH